MQKMQNSRRMIWNSRKIAENGSYVEVLVLGLGLIGSIIFRIFEATFYV